MPMFVLAYRNRPGYTPTPQTQAAWHAWFGSMGDQLADMGKPVIAEAALGNCSRESTEMGGYSLIEADDLEAATAIAKGCPHLGQLRRHRDRPAGRGPQPDRRGVTTAKPSPAAGRGGLGGPGAGGPGAGQRPAGNPGLAVPS